MASSRGSSIEPSAKSQICQDTNATFDVASRLKCPKSPEHGQSAKLGASVTDILANSKIRFDSVKRMTQIQNTS